MPSPPRPTSPEAAQRTAKPKFEVFSAPVALGALVLVCASLFIYFFGATTAYVSQSGGSGTFPRLGGGNNTSGITAPFPIRPNVGSGFSPVECRLGPSLFAVVTDMERCKRLQTLSKQTVVLMLASKPSRLDIVRAAWTFRVPNVHYVGDCNDCTVRTSPEHEHRDGLSPKVFQMFAEAVKMFPEAQVFVKVDTDTYLNYLSLLVALDEYRALHGELPAYMGSVYSLAEYPGFSYCSGGAGYLLRRDVATKVIGPHGNLNEDVAVGLVVRDMGLAPIHHNGFLGDPIEDALRNWLEKRVYHNHADDASVPRYIITTHGYKDPWKLLAVALLTQSSPLELAWLVGKENDINKTLDFLPFLSSSVPLPQGQDGIPPLLPQPLFDRLR
jgi:hypothetical protein